jgi:ubiquinone/menaquinone biosynthesis C-methylase UbiE
MNFDSIAPHFQRLEWLAFGQTLMRCRMYYIDKIKDARRILLLGEGDGRFLLELLALNSSSQVTCLDSSFWMLNRASERVKNGRPGAFDRVTFLQGDALTHELGKDEYDAVVLNFFLDCFNHESLELLIPRTAVATKSGGVWLINDFCQPESGLKALRAKIWLKTMYAFFRMTAKLEATKLENPFSVLEFTGIELRERKTWSWEMLASEWWVKR